MKILYNLLDGVNCGGIERIVFAKVNWLASHGHDVTVVTTDRNGRQPFFPLDKRVKWIDLGINYQQDWTSAIRKLRMHRKRTRQHREALTKVVDSIRPDISISVFGAEAEFLHKLPNAGKKIVEIHFSRYFRLAEFKPSPQYLADIVHTLIDSRIISKYDAFISLTEQDRALWGNLRNIHVIPNFIHDRMPEPAKLDSKRAIAIGRLSYQKGYDRMIKAWEIVAQRHPDWHLDIYGAGGLSTQLHQQIAAAGLSDNITIHDPVSPIEDELMKSSMLLMTSHNEGLPMVILEAMGCGVPTVSFDCQCGPLDMIGERNGIVVKNGDTEAFADAVCRLIENDDLRRKYGDNAYQEVTEYTVEAIMPRWVRLFEELTGKDN